MTWTPTQAFRDARLVGGIASWLDADPVNPAYAVIFDSANVALVTIVFARPAGALVAHELVVSQAAAGGDQILVSGSADHFWLYNGAGVAGGAGDVTDAAGTGAMKITGSNGTMLFAGARAIVSSLKFT
jgi:hypothetical protein